MPEYRSPVISLASTKGGVGKTTLAFVLATEFARHPVNRKIGSPKFRVACIDADPNLTLDTALRKTGSPDILCVRSDAEQLLQSLRDAQGRAGVVIIDLEGSANQAMLYAAGKSDLVLIPAQPSAFDVKEAGKTAEVVRQAADLVGREIVCRVVLSRTPVLRQRVADHSKIQFERAGLPMLTTQLVNRTAFQAMTYSGIPPYAMHDQSGASANVEALAREIAQIVGYRAGQGS